MEELSKDPEIANGIFKFLSTKLTETKSAWQAAEEVLNTPCSRLRDEVDDFAC